MERPAIAITSKGMATHSIIPYLYALRRSCPQGAWLAFLTPLERTHRLG